MRGIYSFFLFFIAFIIQTTVMNSFEILGVTPNLILCLIVVLCFLYDQTLTFTWAIIFGLLQDAYFSEVMGVSAICYFLIALGIYVIKDFVNPENMISTLGILIGSTFLYSLMYFGVATVFGSTVSIMRMLEVQPVLITYNTIIGVIMYKFLIRGGAKHKKDKKFKGRFISYE